MSAPSVPLPKRNSRPETADGGSQPPIWALNSSGTDPEGQTPLPAKCDRHRYGRSGVCCKELKGDDERELIDPDIVRDIIIGLSDGLTVPFALTAGLSGLGQSRIVVLGGLAELIAGAISMGIGGFLSAQAERDYYRYQHRMTAARVLRSCSGEMEREVHAVLGPLGVDEHLSRQVADNLQKVEFDTRGVRSDGSVPEDQLKWSTDIGLTSFLLKLGEQLEEVPNKRMYVSAVTIGSGYFLGGIIPLIPYFFVPVVHRALLYSCIITGVILVLFGIVKARVTGAAGTGFGGYVWGAFSTLAVGGIAAAAAFAIVRALEVNE